MRADGSFEQISWAQALEEIAARIRMIVEESGPDSVAYAGESAAWGGLLIGALGSRGDDEIDALVGGTQGGRNSDTANILQTNRR
jgi:anaerobic selenocysteine-containing dehydrogenase